MGRIGRSLSLGVAIWSLTVARSGLSDEVQFDFHAIFQSCQIVAASLDSDGVPKVLKPESNTHTLHCKRNSKDLNCVLQFTDGSPSKIANYTLDADVPPLLMFGLPNGGDFMMVHQPNHKIVGITRIVDPALVASKVCTGVFLTSTEWEEIKKQGAAATPSGTKKSG